MARIWLPDHRCSTRWLSWSVRSAACVRSLLMAHVSGGLVMCDRRGLRTAATVAACRTSCRTHQFAFYPAVRLRGGGFMCNAEAARSVSHATGKLSSCARTVWCYGLRQLAGCTLFRGLALQASLVGVMHADFSSSSCIYMHNVLVFLAASFCRIGLCGRLPPGSLGRL